MGTPLPIAAQTQLQPDSSQVDWLGLARADVDTLCSPELAGRGYQDQGHLKAASFVAKRFKHLGLQPQGIGSRRGRSYLQPFVMAQNRINGASLSLDGQSLVPGVDFIVNPYSGDGEAEGELLDLGYGLKWNSNKVSGAIVLIRDGLPEKMAENPKRKKKYANRLNLFDRVNALLEAEPAAIIILKEKLTAGYGREQSGCPIVEVKTAALPAETEMAQLAVAAEMARIQTQNVLGSIEGYGEPDSFLLISAHYDHLGKLEEAIFTGANDNASGMAMLLSLAAHYAQPEHQPYYSLLFIAFGAEESGLIGSRYYVAEDPRIPLAQMKFVLNLDLMGNGDEGIVAVGGKDFPEYLALLEAENEALQAVPKVGARPNAPNSDHYFFLKGGVPGFFIYTLGGPPHYHDVYDTAQNLQLSRFEAVRQLLLGFLSRLAPAEERE